MLGIARPDSVFAMVMTISGTVEPGLEPVRAGHGARISRQDVRMACGRGDPADFGTDARAFRGRGADPGAVPVEDVPQEFRAMFAAMQDPEALINRAFHVTEPADPDFNSRTVQAAEFPSSNGIGTAHGRTRARRAWSRP
jgi:hypothetical protein